MSIGEIDTASSLSGTVPTKVTREIKSSNRKEVYFALTASGKQIVGVHELLHKNGGADNRRAR